jgi:hypothetical protein
MKKSVKKVNLAETKRETDIRENDQKLNLASNLNKNSIFFSRENNNLSFFFSFWFCFLAFLTYLNQSDLTQVRKCTYQILMGLKP